jgi:uracil-DNA glycosylase family 4
VTDSPGFDEQCRRCPRLASFLDEVSQQYPSYHARPVAPFGDPGARLLVVGLAPGMHGANASGRPFTGDYAGILLYDTLYRYGFASRPESRAADDGLRLLDCRITNAVKCLPPANKPTGAEVRTCNGYLQRELADVEPGAVVLALGAVAHGAVVKALGLKQSVCTFGHGRRHELPGGRTLLDSYHCSRYNTQTRRLTDAMFHEVFAQARRILDGKERGRRPRRGR